MLSVEVGGKAFPVPRELLLKSAYFEGLLATNPEQIVVQRSRYGFRHVLEFLYDDTYSVPKEHLRELDFYGVPYPRYSTERDDSIKVYVRGEKFKLPARHLILNSKYFAEELPRLYVGQDLHLDRSPEGFRHVLQRMSDCHYVIPYEYRKERNFYGVQEIVWLEDSLLTISNFGRKYCINYKNACKSPFLKSFIDKYESLPFFYTGAQVFERVIDSLAHPASTQIPLERDKLLYERFQIKHDRYYCKSYRKCVISGCEVFLKCLNSSDGWSAKANHDYCPRHTCELCKKKKEWGSSYCVEHTCSSRRCVKQVVEGGKCAEHQ